MRPTWLAGLFLLTAGCARAISPATPSPPADPRFAGIALPAVDDAPAGALPDGPVVSVSGDAIRVDGVLAGRAQPILDAARLMRVDGVFTALKAQRETWKASHPTGTPFPGVVLLAMDGATPAVVVKSVFQTAAFAGFPNTCFVVSHAGAWACVRVDAQVPGPDNGRLAPVVIQRIVRSRFDQYQRCYEAALSRKPDLRGRVTIRFVIGADGSVSDLRDDGSTLPDPEVVACVMKGFAGLSFPVPEGGPVTVVYPIAFAPGD